MTGCVKDNLSEHNESALEHINNPKKDLSVAYFDMDALNEELLLIEPVVAEFKVLSKKISNSKSLKITAESSAGLSSQKSAFKNALVVSKKDKPMSYSISFENQSIEKFANVVVQKDTLGVLKTNVIEYEPTKESVRLYNTGRIGIDQLQGTMRIYESIAGYLEQTSAQGIHIKKTALRFSNPCNNVFDFNFGTGQMRGGGGSKVCSVAKTVIPCRAGGRGEHGPSLCGVGTGSTTVITYQCTRIYTSSISSTLSSMINAVLPLGPCGGGNPSLRNVGINAPFVPLTPCPDQLTCAKADALIDALSALGVTLPRTLKRRVYEGGAFFDFAEAALVALENGGEVDFEEFYISTETPDDNYVYQGPKQKIPSVLVLSNGTKVDVTFITHTKDGISSNQPVATELVNGLKFALEKANSNLSLGDKITNINIYATTNGKHGNESNHYNSTALDINSINGKRMIETGLTNQIKEFQKAFDAFPYIRENYGPYFNHRYEVENNQWDLNRESVKTAHKNHIHFAIRKP